MDSPISRLLSHHRKSFRYTLVGLRPDWGRFGNNKNIFGSCPILLSDKVQTTKKYRASGQCPLPSRSHSASLFSLISKHYTPIYFYVSESSFRQPFPILTTRATCSAHVTNPYFVNVTIRTDAYETVSYTIPQLNSAEVSSSMTNRHLLAYSCTYQRRSINPQQDLPEKPITTYISPA